jgi:hypothetical protein
LARERNSQIEFGPERSDPFGPDAWSAFLSAELDAQVEVVFTRARRTVLKVQPRGALRTVRMNAFFAHAPDPVREAVASWIRSGRRARRKLELLDAWVETQIETVERKQPRALRLVTQGRVHDIEQLAAQLRASHFAADFATDGATSAQAAPSFPRLTWGRAPKSRTRRTLRLGSFDFWTGVVRMHPVLDQRGVPESFVRYVLFHELLHAAMPAERGPSGRRVFHGKEFRSRERAYPGTAAALAWEKQHLAELLWSARTGKDMRTSNVVAQAVAALTRSCAAGEERSAIREPAAPAASAASANGASLRGFVQRWLFS